MANGSETDAFARVIAMSKEEEVPEKSGWLSRLATGLAKSVGDGLD
jgi:hypothetical protein|tara:strand:+ start:6627 stop:6764 length:138 start_codon:yes stop_codon:yes gene_type:complete